MLFMENFTIDLTYDGVSYAAIVIPKQENGMVTYNIKLDSENQESFVEIIAVPPGNGIDQWIFKCPDDQEPFEYYDKRLLEEIGEAIEKNEVSGGDREISEK
jgi:hypothetical protein